MKKIHTIDIQIPGNAATLSKDFTPPLGKVIAVAVYTNGVELTTKEMIKIGLKNDSSIEIIPMVNLDNWRQRSGSYKESFKPVDFDTRGSSHKLQISTNRDIGAGSPAVELQVVLFYEE